MSWDDEGFEPETIGKDKPPQMFVPTFDDEVDSGDVLDDWDAEPSKEEESTTESANQGISRFSKVSGKKSRGRQLKSAEELRKEREQNSASEPVKLTAKQKQELEDQVRASDFKNTEDIFSGLGDEYSSASDGQKRREEDSDALFGGGDEKKSEKKEVEAKVDSLDSFVPETKEQFDKFGKLLAARISPHQDSFHYLEFLKSLLKEVTESLSPEEIKELVSALNVITNTKIKNANVGKKGKKPAKKKVVKRGDLDEDMVEDDYDVFS